MVCGAHITEPQVLPATGHNWEVKESKEPTCNSRGVVLTICANCGARDTQMLDKDPSKHNFVNGECTICGAKQ